MTEARKLSPPLPPRLDWFVQTQVGQLAQGGVPAWFHGAISREDAENLLELQPLGSFLIRPSHSHVGYTLSYKAQGCCRHFMVKLLDDGSFVIPGEERVHASLDALVSFHQRQPVRPHGDLLTQPCGQKDPANVDYENLFLYSIGLTEELTSPAHGPSKHQNPSSYPEVAPKETSGRPMPFRRPEERKPSAKISRDSEKEALSFRAPKAPLEEACQKLWRSFKTLPQTGKRIQQQLKSHLAPVNLSSLRNAGPPPVGHGAGARPGDACWEDDVSTARSVATALVSPARAQDLRDRGDASGKASRLASGSKAIPRVRSWHQAVTRALSSKASKPETEALAEAQKDRLPEEYLTPPPFAPGYC